MPSKSTFTRLKMQGLDLESFDTARYNINDTLASQYDLERLFEVLYNVKDKNGHPCVFTALSVVANPDFTTIRANDFQEYFYEPFTTTLKRYFPNQNVFGLWKEGIENRIFLPQFHGREHLNVAAWMKALKTGQRATHLAFNEGMWGFAPDVESALKVSNQAAFQLTDISDLAGHKKILIEGLNLFESIFGYRAKYFVPPNGMINNSLNQVLAGNGISLRSTSILQKESIGLGKTKKVVHWLGQKDASGIRYIIRNCVFEPSQTSKDAVDSCLNDINISFRWKRPAIINSHRVNYIGVHNSKNSENSLLMLKSLLKEVKRNWPDAEFMTTDKLEDLICAQIDKETE